MARGEAGWVTFAIGLMPFAGIFFLWFIGVVRARLGRLEDQFFSAVFLGSGLIFLAMVFVAAGVAGAIVTGYARDPSGFPGSATYYFARDVVAQIFAIYALRMAAVFVISLATLWLDELVPRWMAFLSLPDRARCCCSPLPGRYGWYSCSLLGSSREHLHPDRYLRRHPEAREEGGFDRAGAADVRARERGDSRETARLLQTLQARS